MGGVSQDDYRERYKTKTTPWDIGRPDYNLVDIVSKRPIEPCRVLDVGCGFGHNSIWLAQQGFTVTGVDVSEIAAQNAKENGEQARVDCTFFRLDFFEDDILGLPFEFIFDRGCFHSYGSDDERRKFVERAAHHLGEAGLWLSLVGSADQPPGILGPSRRSARDIVVAAEPLFEILSLTAIRFDSNHENPSKAWACLMKKRSE